LNPVKTKRLENNPLNELKKKLRSYKYSSFKYYLGVAKKPDWINISFVLSSWSKNKEQKILNYRKYIEEGLLSDNHQEIAEDQLKNITGSEPFRDKITRKFLSRRLKLMIENNRPLLNSMPYLCLKSYKLLGNIFQLKTLIKLL
jgi:hypothetical protein